MERRGEPRVSAGEAAIAVEAMGTACGCGKWSCRRWWTNPVSALTVCHLSPGTSKWNKIEYRLFSPISMNFLDITFWE